jgi:hypothetical protein
MPAASRRRGPSKNLTPALLFDDPPCRTHQDEHPALHYVDPLWAHSDCVFDSNLQQPTSLC